MTHWHISSGFSDVQAIGGSSNQVIEQGHPVPMGYVINTSSGPLSTPGPSIHLPGNNQQYPGPPSTHPQNRNQPQAVGYTHAHATYAAERHERMQQAYSTHNAEVVVIEVRMVLMLPGRVQIQLIHVCDCFLPVMAACIYVNLIIPGSCRSSGSHTSSYWSSGFEKNALRCFNSTVE
jgi:hypothetical protein